MAVFTPVSLDDLTEWIKAFPLGEVLAVHGIASGIENSNFFITTRANPHGAGHGNAHGSDGAREYVLTIFETLGFEQLPFYLHYMRHLAKAGVLVPEPVPNLHGDLITPLHGKPAAIVSKLEGTWQVAPQAVHCAAVGQMLAKMHLAGRDFPLHQPNLRSIDWWNGATPVVMPFLSESRQHLLQAEMHFQQAFFASALYHQLPQGPIHADLFRNNVMFCGEQLSGFFDFYFAGCDTWLFDVAVTVNDWCIDLATGVPDLPRMQALLAAYHAVRPFAKAESQAWPAMLRAAALRFWLSRLYDFHLPREAQMLTPHDPAHFERILRERIAHPTPGLYE